MVELRVYHLHHRNARGLTDLSGSGGDLGREANVMVHHDLLRLIHVTGSFAKTTRAEEFMLFFVCEKDQVVTRA